MENFIAKVVFRTNKTVLRARNAVHRLITDENGEANLVSILLIIVVTVALVAIFKTQITNLINGIFAKINNEVSKI